MGTDAMKLLPERQCFETPNAIIVQGIGESFSCEGCFEPKLGLIDQQVELKIRGLALSYNSKGNE